MYLFIPLTFRNNYVVVVAGALQWPPTINARCVQVSSQLCGHLPGNHGTGASRSTIPQSVERSYNLSYSFARSAAVWDWMHRLMAMMFSVECTLVMHCLYWRVKWAHLVVWITQFFHVWNDRLSTTTNTWTPQHTSHFAQQKLMCLLLICSSYGLCEHIMWVAIFLNVSSEYFFTIDVTRMERGPIVKFTTCKVKWLW